jgi:hypothetical protein
LLRLKRLSIASVSGRVVVCLAIRQGDIAQMGLSERVEAFIISSGDEEGCEISFFGEASARSGASFRYENGKDGVPQRQAQNIAFHYSTCGNTALSPPRYRAF